MAETIEEAYRTAVHNISSNISQFVQNPEADFTRNRKLGIEMVFNYLVANGGESSKDELLDLCAGMDDPPSVQAMVRQRAKLLPKGVRELLLELVVVPESLQQANVQDAFLWEAPAVQRTRLFWRAKHGRQLTGQFLFSTATTVMLARNTTVRVDLVSAVHSACS